MNEDVETRLRYTQVTATSPIALPPVMRNRSAQEIYYRAFVGIFG